MQLGPQFQLADNEYLKKQQVVAQAVESLARTWETWIGFTTLALTAGYFGYLRSDSVNGSSISLHPIFNEHFFKWRNFDHSIVLLLANKKVVQSLENVLLAI